MRRTVPGSLRLSSRVRRRPRLTAVWLAAATLAAASCVLAPIGGHQASGAVRPSVSTTVVQALSMPAGGAQNVELNSVSCPDPRFCVAVGEYRPAGRWMSDQGEHAVVMRFDGTRWSAMSAPEAPDTELNGVDCVASSTCVAVGESVGAEGDSVSLHRGDARDSLVYRAVTGPHHLLGRRLPPRLRVLRVRRQLHCGWLGHGARLRAGAHTGDGARRPRRDDRVDGRAHCATSPDPDVVPRRRRDHPLQCVRSPRISCPCRARGRASSRRRRGSRLRRTGRNLDPAGGITAGLQWSQLLVRPSLSRSRPRRSRFLWSHLSWRPRPPSPASPAHSGGGWRRRTPHRH